MTWCHVLPFSKGKSIMGTLLDQLFLIGPVPGHQEREEQLKILRETSSPDTFRKEARKLLLNAPDLLPGIINIAHTRGMHKSDKKSQGGGRLAADLYQLRGAFEDQNLKGENRESLVQRLFSDKSRTSSLDEA